MLPILVPYHLDEPLSDLDLPLAPHHTVTGQFVGDDTWQRMAALYRPVVDLVASAVDAVPVVMSGDCTTSLATVAGLQRTGRNPSVVWFDAHGDLQTLETTTSGYLGGLPLRMLVGYRPELLGAAIGLEPIDAARVVLVDARDLDPPEADYLASSPMQHVGVEQLIADRVPEGPVYLHIDLDVVDPDELPGLLFPAPGGPGIAAVADAVARVMATGRVAAVGLGCTWRPGHEVAERIAAVTDALR